MSRSIDERVVQMQFENSQFEKGIKQSTDSLKKLDDALKFDSANTGIESVQKSIKGIDLSVISDAAQIVSQRFSTLGVIATRVLQNITDSVMRAGSAIMNQFALEPILTGFQEYETQIGAIQTILTNTESKGTTLTQVNQALDELNKYADQTIYNFTEMTRNIGTFTAAGVDLQTSVDSIKGLANLAAVSGSTANQASVAMYQLSQAIAAGKVQLMDWNSIVNAGMGGELFQNALKRTAENFGTNVDAMISKYGSFRESLTKGGWLTTEVLTETLKQLSGAYTQADLMAQGYTEDQAQQIVDLAETAVNAATKVKTFSQFFDTLKEAVQSGWTNTWEIIIGDFNEAQDLLTGISDRIGGMIQASADARNQLLSEGLSSGWKQLLNEGISNEDEFIDSIKNVAREHGIAIDEMVDKEGSFTNTLKDGWLTTDMLGEAVTNYSDRLSAMSEEELQAAGYTEDHVKQLTDLKAKLDDGSLSLEEFVEKMERPSGRENIIEALGDAFDYLISIIQPIKEAFAEVFPPATGEQIYQWTVRIKEFADGLTLSDGAAEKLKSAFKGLFSAADLVLKGVSSILGGLRPLTDIFKNLGFFVLDAASSLGDYISGVNESAEASSAFSKVSDTLSAIFSGISELVSGLATGLSGLKDVFSSIGKIAEDAFGTVFDILKEIVEWLAGNVTLDDIISTLVGAGTISALDKLGGTFDKISGFFDMFTKPSEAVKSGGIGNAISDTLNQIKSSLEEFTKGIQVASLVAIAVALETLSDAVETLSALRIDQLTVSLVAVKVMLSELGGGFKQIVKTLQTFKAKGVVGASVALLALAEAVKILAEAMVLLKDLDLEETAQGLISIGVSVAALVAGLKFLNGVKVNFSTSVALLALAEATKILSEALQEFSKLSFDEIERGLIAMGGAIAELTASISILGKFGNLNSLIGSLGIVVAVQALDEIAQGLESMGSLTWEEIQNGLIAMGGAFTELTVSLGILSKVGGFGSLLSGGAIALAVEGLEPIANFLKDVSSLTWDEIQNGLIAMGGAFTQLTASLGILSYVGGFGSLLSGGAITLAVEGLEPIATFLQDISSLTWEEIQNGLIAMGAAFTELTVSLGILATIGGFQSILGGGAILTTVQALEPIAETLKSIGSLTWDEITRGLYGMGGALLEVSLLSGALGSIAGLAGILGGAAIWVTVQGLDDLANALKKFSEMSWDEIGRGLSAMGTAMAEVAIGGLLNTLSGFGAAAISEIAGSLGILADSVKKWAGVTVPDDLDVQLNKLAGGVMSFTFSGWGADSISTVAEPLGAMAESVKKWQGVVIPENLGTNLEKLASGVNSFFLGDIGANALANAAPGVGDMADAVKKWQGVTIPEGIDTGLTGIAKGVQAFSFAFVGGFSISSIIDPLKRFPEAITPWNDVDIPEGLEADLTSLANGVNAFSLSFVAGFSISSVIDPLKNLAEAVKSWNGIDINGLGDQLQSFAKGVNDLATSGLTNLMIADFDLFLSTLESNFSSTTTNVLLSVDNMLSSLSSRQSEFSSIASQYMLQFSNGISTGVPVVTQTFSNAFTSITGSLRTRLPQFMQFGEQTVEQIRLGASSKQGLLKQDFSELIIKLVNEMTNKLQKFKMAMQEIIDTLSRTVVECQDSVRSSFSSMLDGCINVFEEYRSKFKDVSSYMIDGVIEGINERASDAAEAAARMALDSYNAAMNAIDARSPSRLFRKGGSNVPWGYALGIKDGAQKVIDASNEMAKVSFEATKNAFETLEPLFKNSMDISPRIRPVLDLSNIKSGSRSVQSILGSVGVGIARSSDYAQSTARSVSSNRTGHTPAGMAGSPQVVNNFTQNNYSPKSLSRTDIYRDSKNLLSRVR